MSVPGKEQEILDALGGLGYRPDDVRHILVTHLHADPSGGLRRQKRTTGAPTHMRPLHAEAVRQGVSSRPTRAARGLLPWLITDLFIRFGDRPGIEPAPAEHELEDGQVLPFAGGPQVIHVPGHVAGQVAVRLEPAGVLFAGDAAANIMGLGFAPNVEDLASGLEGLRRLGALDFDIGCFGHGGPIVGDGGDAFSDKWAAE